MLSRWFGFRRAHEKIKTPAALGEALLREANLVTQKCLIGYCHARTMLPMNELMKDKVFAEAYWHSRAASFAAVLADFVLVAESRLRAGGGADPSEALAAMYRRLLAAQPEIAGRVEAETAAADFDRRLAQLRLSPPKSSAEVAEHSGQRLFDALPIHERLRRPDRDTVVASVRFMIMSRFQALDRRFAIEALTQALANAAPAAPGTTSN